MTQPLVSVKMITYNHGPYIENSINRVLNQKTNFPYELVIGEDFSTDETREIVFDYQKKYPETIRVITSDSNVGARKNSDRVQVELRGKYISYCEGDDYWHDENKLQMQVDYLESHPECGMVASDYDRLTVKGNIRVKNYRRAIGKPIVPSPTMEQILTGRSGIQTLTVLARLDLVEKVRTSDPFLHQNPDFKMGDTQLWAEMALEGDIHCIDKSLATHLILPESATQSQDPTKVMKFRINGAELCLCMCEKHQLPKYLWEMHQRTWTRHSIRLAFAERDAEAAEKARSKYGNLSLTDKVWYLGTKYPAFHGLVRLVSMLTKPFTRKKKGFA